MGTKQKLPKNQVRFIKAFLKRINCDNLIPKFNKSKCFWKDMDEVLMQIHYDLDDYTVGRDIQYELRDIVQDELWNPNVKIPGVDYYISMWDFWVHSLSLQNAVTKNFSPESKVYKQVTDMLDLVSSYTEEVHDHFNNSLAKKFMPYSNPESFIYGFRLEIVTTGLEPRIVIHISREESDRRKIVFNNKERTVFRPAICWRNSIIIKPEVKLNNNIYDLYIQAHAIRRMEERLKPITAKEFLRYIIMRKDLEPELIPYKGSYLLPFSYCYIVPVGYFVCEIIEDICVIKTFLFISQDGTPEGDQLSQKLDIKRVGKSHLKLAMLNHFIESDIREDERLTSILEECELKHLIEDFRSPEKLKESAKYIHDTLQL